MVKRQSRSTRRSNLEERLLVVIAKHLDQWEGIRWEPPQASRFSVSMLGYNGKAFLRLTLDFGSTGVRVEIIRPREGKLPPYPEMRHPISESDYVDLLDLIAAADPSTDIGLLSKYPETAEDAINLLIQYARPSLEGSYSPFTDPKIIRRINERLHETRLQP